MKKHEKKIINDLESSDFFDLTNPYNKLNEEDSKRHENNINYFKGNPISARMLLRKKVTKKSKTKRKKCGCAK